MQFKDLGIKTVICGCALVAGILIGAISFSNISPTLADGNNENQKSSSSVYSVNENGETYGSDMNANSLEDIPDLIQAFGIDGTFGYVKAKDLYGTLPKTPDEAVAISKNNIEKGDYTIPLYDVDGKTVIGKFRISCKEPTKTKAEDKN